MNARKLEPVSVHFRRAREAEWSELEGITERVLRGGLGKLSEEELGRLPTLYRSVVSSLAVARSTALDHALVEYLEALASRAYLVVYGMRKPSRAPLRSFLFETVPESVARIKNELALCTLIFFAGTAVAYVLVHQDSSWFYAFVPEELAGGRDPSASTEELRKVLFEKTESHATLLDFASQLFSHNARIGMLSFVIGFMAGVPTVLLQFYNGLMLGAFVALYADRGLLVPILAWLLPHGIPEIGAIILCGAAGLHVARGILYPGRLRIRDALAQNGRRASLVVAGTVILFAIAGVVEGVFRQVIVDERIRFAIAGFNALWMFLWFVTLRRGRA